MYTMVYVITNEAILRVRTYAFGTLNPTILYTAHGSYGNNWKLAQATVRSGSPYQIVFEGVLDTSDNGSDSIAIDDVGLQNGECGEFGTCDFEKGLCGYQYLKADFDWKRTSYSVEIINAPQFDHTTNTRTG